MYGFNLRAGQTSWALRTLVAVRFTAAGALSAAWFVSWRPQGRLVIIAPRVDFCKRPAGLFMPRASFPRWETLLPPIRPMPGFLFPSITNVSRSFITPTKLRGQLASSKHAAIDSCCPRLCGGDSAHSPVVIVSAEAAARAQLAAVTAGAANPTRCGTVPCSRAAVLGWTRAKCVSINILEGAQVWSKHTICGTIHWHLEPLLSCNLTSETVTEDCSGNTSTTCCPRLLLGCLDPRRALRSTYLLGRTSKATWGGQ